MTKDEEMALRELAAGRCVIQKVTEQLGPMSLWSRDGLERELAKAREEEAAKWARGAKVSIPAVTYEQELAMENKKGYEHGYMAASREAEMKMAALKAQIDALMSAYSGMASLQANPPVKLLANAESYEAGVIAEREACAQICADRAKDFHDLFLKYRHEEDAGAEVGATQCEELIRARGQQ